jgi:hypothetical protein
MNAFSSSRPPLLWGLSVCIIAIAIMRLTPSRYFDWPSVQAAPAIIQAVRKQRQDNRFDMLVRDDFFAGMMGDTARLDRGMKICEDILAKSPKDAEALVWHGGGLLTRAAQAYTKGDSALGDRLWTFGIKEMNDARAVEPANMGVKIGRSATLIGIAQSGWDQSDSQARRSLRSALLDYEEVYRQQQSYFDKLSNHSRGELLFGLASGWSILGDHRKARDYLLLILKFCKDTAYEIEARPWLDRQRQTVIQHDCVGCHVRSSGY